jgi:hypothetical protein
VRQLATVAAALLIHACAFVPQVNHRLEDVKRTHAQALGEGQVAVLAPAEWFRASEAVDTAILAHGTLQDPAIVDHLAYVAKQRIEIARETARRMAAEAAVATARKVSLQR